MSLLDVALCTAARTLHPESIGVITIDMSTSFIGGGKGASFFADARVMKDGKSMSFVEAEAKNEDGSLVAKAIATVRVRLQGEAALGGLAAREQLLLAGPRTRPGRRAAPPIASAERPGIAASGA